MELMRRNGSPNVRCIGRGFKAGKEEIVGAWKALALFVDETLERHTKLPANRFEDAYAKLNGGGNVWGEPDERAVSIMHDLGEFAGICIEIPPYLPHVWIGWPAGKTPTGKEVAALLLDGSPRLSVRPSSKFRMPRSDTECTHGIAIQCHTLRSDECRIVARLVGSELARIEELLNEA